MRCMRFMTWSDRAYIYLPSARKGASRLQGVGEADRADRRGRANSQPLRTVNGWEKGRHEPGSRLSAVEKRRTSSRWPERDRLNKEGGEVGPGGERTCGLGEVGTAESQMRHVRGVARNGGGSIRCRPAQHQLLEDLSGCRGGGAFGSVARPDAFLGDTRDNIACGVSPCGALTRAWISTFCHVEMNATSYTAAAWLGGEMRDAVLALLRFPAAGCEVRDTKKETRIRDGRSSGPGSSQVGPSR